jgi:peptidoglycan hydrolase-like protein with peptidoglycan-binding domain
MRQLITIFIFFIGITANAQADLNAGLDAYKKKDYRTALKEFKLLADQGDADAQFFLGHMYASGKGVLQDYIKAHVWFNISAAQGNENAAATRDKIAERMTIQQIAKAQKLAREWRPADASAKPSSEGASLSEIELIQRIQENLSDLGYDPGPSDGKIGSRTRRAIRQYQKQEGLQVNGEPSQDLLAHIQKTLGNRVAVKKLPEKPALGVKTFPGKKTLKVIDQLKKIVQKGKQEKRADSLFLSELYELIRRYDWPWRNRLFRDKFQDGELARNPTWTIASGEFWIDSYKRLVSRFSPPEQKKESSSDRETTDTGSIILKTILTEVLKEKETEPSTPPPPLIGEIYSAFNISNMFSLDIELTLLAGGNDARLEFGPYRGKQRDEGYRLNYVGGRTPVFELTRQTSAGSSTIATSKSASILKDGQPHVIRWQRYSDGNMVIALDAKVMIQTIDRTLQHSFDGISIVNRNGNYAFSHIQVSGKKE